MVYRPKPSIRLQRLFFLGLVSSAEVKELTMSLTAGAIASCSSSCLTKDSSTFFFLGDFVAGFFAFAFAAGDLVFDLLLVFLGVVFLVAITTKSTQTQTSQWNNRGCAKFVAWKTAMGMMPRNWHF